MAGTPSIFNDATLDQSTVIILEQSTVIILEQSTVIILEQSTVIILESDKAAALAGTRCQANTGHGTMVSSRCRSGSRRLDHADQGFPGGWLG